MVFPRLLSAIVAGASFLAVPKAYDAFSVIDGKIPYLIERPDLPMF